MIINYIIYYKIEDIFSIIFTLVRNYKTLFSIKYRDIQSKDVLGHLICKDRIHLTFVDHSI